MFKKLTLAVVLACNSDLLMAEEAAAESKSKQTQVMLKLKLS